MDEPRKIPFGPPRECIACKRPGPDLRVWRAKGPFCGKRLCDFCRGPLEAERKAAREAKAKAAEERRQKRLTRLLGDWDLKDNCP